MIKILFIINDLRRGGAERFLVDHCNALLNNKNIEFKVCVLNDFNQFTEETKNFEIINLNYKSFSFRGNNKNEALETTIQNFKPHIIHSNLFLSEFITTFELDYDIKYVCHGHDNMFQYKPFNFSNIRNKYNFTNYLEKMVLFFRKYIFHKTFFIANSEHTYRYYKNVLPCYLKTEVVKIDYGFNFDKFYDEKEKYYDEKEKFKIINVGSFQHKKNQRFIIKIAKELLKVTSNFEINLIGDGTYVEEVKKLIEESNLENHVVLRGIQNNVETWYKNSDLYLHTAYYEPFGLVFLEAMASGLPVVCLDGKGNKDIIKNNENGFIFDVENAKEFAAKIIELKENKILYKQISNYCKVFSEKYSLENKTKEFIDFYNHIIHE